MNMRVRVYRNLTGSCLSIQARTSKGWRVVAHAGHVYLHDVDLTVNEAARQRVLKTGRKEVHAFAVGDLQGWWGIVVAPYESPEYAQIQGLFRPVPRPNYSSRVAYNPRRCGSFTLTTGHIVQETRAVSALPSLYMTTDDCLAA